jgi:hypothetical protein
LNYLNLPLLPEGSGPSKLERRDKTACNRTRTNIGVSAGTIVTQWQEKLDKLEKPTGVRVTFGVVIKKIKVKVLVHWNCLTCSHHISLPSNGRVI